ncbi:MAG TPA: FAD-linked oxidase C-terminal domain-containing protein [Pyrinomonadaceae bacterium]|nr:FAD-linked oxidase C-terminal domain-containing protein [Pyrinomonadaceae bacterium]
MDKLAAQLRALLTDAQVLSSPDELLVYECDGLTHYRARPRAVVFPHSTEEVAEVVRLLARERVPFAPRGAGTGLSGGALALGGGVCIELARMRRVLRLDAESRTAVVEAGVINAQVSRAAAPHGLYYVPDPSSQATCTVGGNIAENAGGIHCLKYGTTVDHVLAARVVLSDGSIVALGGASDEPEGYDLLGLFVGSEGTFGIATEATLRLTPAAPAVRTLLADFAEVDTASRAVSAIIAAGLVPAALEMVDGATIRAVEQSVFAAGMPIDAAAALLVELDGVEAGLDEEAARVARICREAGARGVRLARGEAERRMLWAARKGAFGALGRLSPDLMLQDAVVPRSRLPEVLAETYRVGTKYRLRVANVFHAGDGNLHPFICYDSRDPDEVRRVKEAGREIVETCVRAGGTITGEHGVGLDKSEYLPLVCSVETLEAMLRVRAAFDPKGLCNPGKVIPAPPGCGEARAAVRGDGQNTDAQTETTGPPTVRAGLPGDDTRARLMGRGDGATEIAVLAADAESGAGTILAADDERGAAAAGAAALPSTFAPADVEEAGRFLLAAGEAGRRVAVVGSSPRPGVLEDERAAGRVFLSTERLSRLVSHEPADLVATAEAGMTLGEFNELVGRAGQWLPLDAPGGEGETLGAIVARGMGGPQAFGYGPPRRHVLGMTVALAGGEVIRAGGRVVKNVAGYDLCKLFTGSRGTLGAILDLTFRLRPRPRSERTLVARSPDLGALLLAARSLLTYQLFPVALELLSPALAADALTADVFSEASGGASNEASGGASDESGRGAFDDVFGEAPDRGLGADDGGGDHALVLRFAGSEAAVESQLARAGGVCAAAARVRVSTVKDDAQLWCALAAPARSRGAGLAWRASVPPAALEQFLAEVAGRAGRSAWQACAGDGRVRAFEELGPGADEAAATAAELSRLRGRARAAGGSLVVWRVPADFAREFDVWGLSPEAAELTARVKQQLDPRGLFGPAPGR